MGILLFVLKYMYIFLLLEMINGFSWPAKIMVSPFKYYQKQHMYIYTYKYKISMLKYKFEKIELSLCLIIFLFIIHTAWATFQVSQARAASFPK